MQDLIAVIIFVSIGLGCIFGLNMFLNKQTKDKIDQCGSFEVQGCKYWQCIADKSLSGQTATFYELRYTNCKNDLNK